MGGEEELRLVSAATAGCWELRFQCAVARERRVLRRLAGLDGSQGTSADNEVAVVGNSRDEPEPGQTARGEVVTTLSSGAAEEPAGAWLATAGRSAGRSRNRDRRPAVESRRRDRRRCQGGCWERQQVFGSSAEHRIDCRVVGRDRPTVVHVRRAVTRSVV